MPYVHLRSDSMERGYACQRIPWGAILSHIGVDRGPAFQRFDVVDPTVFIATFHDAKAVLLSSACA